MAAESRTHKSLLNARVNIVFYILSLIVSFFSRKIFLSHLGADFIGLIGTLGNILGMLNLAELGISSAVSFALYKAIADADRQEICRIVSVFGCLYRYIGLAIVGGGVVVSCFIPLIFSNTVFDLYLIYSAFWSILISALLGYFVNFRQILLSADQRNYVVTAYYQSITILKTLIQIFVACYWGNLYLWLTIELFFSIIYSFILNMRIRRAYPWLNATVREGKRIRRQYREIVTKTRQVFIHKLKDFIIMQSDQILIFAFVSLKMVAYYGNYTLVISKIVQFFSTLTDGITAGVGNLIAEGNKERIYGVFREMLFIRFFISGVVVFALYVGIQPFIALWLGKEYLLSHGIVVLIMITTFISMSRGAVDMFNFGYGNFHDTWSAWVEGAINITVTIITCSLWGLPGVLIGKLASMLPIIVIWKPIFLYRDGFKRGIGDYWRMVGLTMLCFAGSFATAAWIGDIMGIDPYGNFGTWVAYCLVTTLTFALLYVGSQWLMLQGARDMTRRLFRGVIKG